MVAEWHYSLNGAQQGPVTEAHLKQLASSGKLRPNDPVWKQGMGKWVPASSVPGLFTTLARSPGSKHAPTPGPHPLQYPDAVPSDLTVPAPKGRGRSPVAVILICVGVGFVLFAALCAGGVAIALHFIFSVEDATNRDLAKAEIMGTLVPAVERYRSDAVSNPTGDLPTTLNDLVNNPKAGLKPAQMIDPWGQPFQFSPQSSHGNEYDIWSPGSGGVPVGNWK